MEAALNKARWWRLPCRTVYGGNGWRFGRTLSWCVEVTGSSCRRICSCFNGSWLIVILSVVGKFNERGKLECKKFDDWSGWKLGSGTRGTESAIKLNHFLRNRIHLKDRVYFEIQVFYNFNLFQIKKELISIYVITFQI